MTNEEAQNQLDDIDNEGKGLTDWEANFVDEMLEKTDGGYAPTEQEAATIKRIHIQRVGSL